MLECKLAITEVWGMIVKTGYINAIVCEFSIQNIVANYKFGKSIELTKLYRTYQNESNYSPELFPGLVMRFVNTKVVYLVFESGNAVITGSQSIPEVDNKAKHLGAILKEVYGEVKESAEL